MRKMLGSSFFNRPTIAVAQELIGKYIVRQWQGKNIALMITEVEAYDGLNDLASHASRGRTPRTSIMFGAAGHWYVYFTYGMHWLLDNFTGQKYYPAAILIRAGRADDGQYVRGPARLTKFLKIDGHQNEKLASKKNSLWIEDRNVKIPHSKIIATKRIGVDYAGP